MEETEKAKLEKQFEVKKPMDRKWVELKKCLKYVQKVKKKE